MNKITFRQIDAPEMRKSDTGRRMTFVASDGTRDSAGTVLNVNGWNLERFNKNGIIGYQHKVYNAWDDTANPDNIIGKGHAYVDGGKLMVDVDFEPADINPLAEKIYQKLLFGSLKAVSVGFIPLGKGFWGEGEESRSGERPTYYYAGQELLEVSVVNIPANPNALKKSYIEEAIDAEMEELRAEDAPEVEDPEVPEVEEEHEEDDRAVREAAAVLDATISVARATLSKV